MRPASCRRSGRQTTRRRIVSERAALVRSIRRVKSRVQAVLHANLVSGYAGHLFGKGGRRWLATAPLAKAERDLLTRHLDELDWLGGKLEKLDSALARTSLDDARMRKLMSIAGISSVVAKSVIAVIGDISRFPLPDRLARYFGLTPRVRQSGDHHAIHGRISKHPGRQPDPRVRRNRDHAVSPQISRASASGS